VYKRFVQAHVGDDKVSPAIRQPTTVIQRDMVGLVIWKLHYVMHGM
jgi:hypothetical protein